MYKRVLLKLSGEALSSEGKCLDTAKMREVGAEIEELIKMGIKVGVVCGGGNIMRGRFADELGIDVIQADYIGMTGTVINSLTLKAALDGMGVKTIVQSSLHMPDLCEDLDPETANRELDDGYVVVFGAGTGKPQCSTDTAAAMRAKDINADVILIAKNGVDGVYTADPNKDASATKYDILTYKEMLERKLGVVDLQAAHICDENSIDSVVFDMNVKGNIIKAAAGLDIGTRVVKEVLCHNRNS